MESHRGQQFTHTIIMEPRNGRRKIEDMKSHQTEILALDQAKILALDQEISTKPEPYYQFCTVSLIRPFAPDPDHIHGLKYPINKK